MVRRTGVELDANYDDDELYDIDEDVADERASEDIGADEDLDEGEEEIYENRSRTRYYGYTGPNTFMNPSPYGYAGTHRTFPHHDHWSSRPATTSDYRQALGDMRRAAEDVFDCLSKQAQSVLHEMEHGLSDLRPYAVNFGDNAQKTMNDFLTAVQQATQTVSHLDIHIEADARSFWGCLNSVFDTGRSFLSAMSNIQLDNVDLQGVMGALGTGVNVVGGVLQQALVQAVPAVIEGVGQIMGNM